MKVINSIFLLLSIAFWVGCDIILGEPPVADVDEGIAIAAVLFGKKEFSNGSIGETATEFQNVNEVYYQINFEESISRATGIVIHWEKDGELLDSEGWLRVMKGKGLWGKLMNVRASKSKLDPGEYRLSLKIHDFETNERLQVPINVTHSFRIID